MFLEYRLKPEARTKALVDSIVSGSVMIISPLTVWIFLLLAEPETLGRHKMAIYVFTGVLFLLAILVTVSMFQKLVNFRMVSTDRELEVQTVSGKLIISYADITKVEQTGDGVLLIYTNSSAATPVVAISDTITNRETLETILKQFVEFTGQAKLPLIYNRYFKYCLSYVFITAMFIHVISKSGNTVIATGLLVLAACVWTFMIQFRFRKEIPLTTTLVVYGLIALVVFVRTLLFVYSSFIL